MSDTLLQVWLSGKHLGELERLRTGSLRLRFSRAAVDRLGVGARALSLSLPMTTKRVEGPALERFVEGLLPESPVRQAIEREHGIRPGDSFALLAAIGQECAGAVQFTTDAEPEPGRLHELSGTEAAALVRQLPTLSPPDGLLITASLGGVQSKVLLTRTPRGWAWPAGGAMSTHLIKPEPRGDATVNNLIQAEEWTLRLARNVGLSAARASVEDFDGRRALVVERYDRLGGERSHQEDFAQALGFAPSEKYESPAAGQHRLLRISREAGALAADEGGFVRELLRDVAFNLIVGNGDAHSKNYSLLIDKNAVFSMAPLYDAAPVFVMNSNLFSAGHALNYQVDLKYLTLAHLVAESSEWGIPSSESTSIVEELAEAIIAATPGTDAVDEIAELPAQVSARSAKLLEVFRG